MLSGYVELRPTHMPANCMNGRLVTLLQATEFRSIGLNTPATLSPTSVGDAHNWRVFIA